MKTFGKLIALFIVGAAANASAQTTESMEEWNWHNVLNIQPNTQNLNTLNFPTATLRPYRGSHLKVTIPTSCGEIRYSGVTAFGRDQLGRPITLDIKRIGQTFHRGAEEYYYVINNGKATVFNLGISVYLSQPWSCSIAIEQADRDVDANGVDSECDQYLRVVCPAVYDPATCTARDFSNNVLMRQQGGNSCEASNALKLAICQRDGMHFDRDYKITCTR